MLQAVSWWAAIQVLGLMALPISFRVFRSLPDKGYAFSKMLGLLLFSYLAWLSASVKILPNHKYALVFFLLAAGGVFAGWVFKHSCGVRHGAPGRYGEDDTRGRYSERNPLAELGSHLKRRMPLVLAVEVIFAAAFAL
ncbi:MAG: hypothetical protein HYY29_05215, partial [Chloroflexi bacterium]|nr:hypothetical protein [Chloroflexota bacterium]